MAETMKGLKRTCRCGEVTNALVGQSVTVMGWVAKQRNKGGIIFVDMRDRAGLLQVIFEESDCGAENFAKAEKLRSEFVIAVVEKYEGFEYPTRNITSDTVNLSSSNSIDAFLILSLRI